MAVLNGHPRCDVVGRLVHLDARVGGVRAAVARPLAGGRGAVAERAHFVDGLLPRREHVVAVAALLAQRNHVFCLDMLTLGVVTLAIVAIGIDRGDSAATADERRRSSTGERYECGRRDCPAFRSGESRSPPPPRDPSSDGRPAVGCSLPRLTRCHRRTATERPCGRAPRTAVPEGRGFHVGSRGPNRSDRTPPSSVPAQDRSAGGRAGPNCPT